MSTSLTDSLHDVLKSVHTRPLLVMRLEVHKLQIVGTTPGSFRPSGLSMRDPSRVSGCPAQSLTGAATGRM